MDPGSGGVRPSGGPEGRVEERTEEHVGAGSGTMGMNRNSAEGTPFAERLLGTDCKELE